MHLVWRPAVGRFVEDREARIGCEVYAEQLGAARPD